MGFFFDALRSLLADSPEGRRAARAGMAGKMWHTEGRRLDRGALSPEDDYEVWHYPKGGKHGDFAITMTVGSVAPGGCEYLVCTLADASGDESPWAGVLAHVRTLDPAPRVGDVVSLPEGSLGRSSHRRVLLARPRSLRQAELSDYEAVLESTLVELITVTDREAEWIGEHGAAAFLERMEDQGVRTLADRRPGDTRLTSSGI